MPDVMIWAALGRLRHVYEAAATLILGDLPPEQREHHQEALVIARAFCRLSEVERYRAFDHVVNDGWARTIDLEYAAKVEPRLRVLAIADWMDDEPFVRERTRTTRPGKTPGTSSAWKARSWTPTCGGRGSCAAGARAQASPPEVLAQAPPVTPA
jgi:hypothetical protein